jgi:hypothetical protein
MKHISGATVLGLAAILAALPALAQTTQKAEKPLALISSQDGKPAQPPGPFGFYFGETRDQVLAAVGKPAILAYNENVLKLATAPKPYPGVDSYTLVFSPTTNGIICVHAQGEPLRVNDEGDQLKSEFHRIEEGLASAYGPPSHQFDSAPADSAAAEPQFWMFSLFHEERQLLTAWDGKKSPLPNHLTTVLLKAEAADISHGSIEILYYFEGYAAYSESMTRKQNGVL